MSWIKSLADTCDHEGEYLRMGDHVDVTSKFVPGQFSPNQLVCVRCESVVQVLVDDCLQCGRDIHMMSEKPYCSQRCRRIDNGTWDEEVQ